MNKLEASVFATNEAHKEARKLYELLVPIFRPLVGTKILKADNSFTQKVEKLIPKFPYGSALRITLHNYRTYSLAWDVKCSAEYQEEYYDRYDDKMTVREVTLYRDCTVYIGKMESGVLKEICPPSEYHRTDYTVEEVLAARKKFKEAEEVYNAAKSALGLFGEYDRD